MPDLLSGAPERSSRELIPKEVSGVEADDQTLENLPESKDTFLEEASGRDEAPVTKIAGVSAGGRAQEPTPTSAPKDDVTLRVEKILEEDLGELYATLPESAKPKFKEKGERAAVEISAMVRSLKLKARRALELIRDWLLVIPAVNRFFLEQEAKIKVDMLTELIAAEKEERMKQR